MQKIVQEIAAVVVVVNNQVQYSRGVMERERILIINNNLLQVSRKFNRLIMMLENRL
jgi:hypothetical protein